MPNDNHNQKYEFQELLLRALEEESRQTVIDLLSGLHPAEIADSLEALPRELRPKLWQQVDITSKGEVMLEIHDEIRRQLIEITPEEELLSALATLEMDELADLDADLPMSVLDTMVQTMDAQRRDRYEAVRSYPDNTAGGLMDVDAAVVRGDVSLKAVQRYLRQLRSREGKLPEHLDSIMVVDRNNVYLGVLQLSDLVSLDADTKVSEVMSARVPSIAVLTPSAKVARVFEDQDLLSAPVVNETNQLLGRITIDDVVDVMRGDADRQVMSRAGLTESGDMFAPILSSAAKRAIWLGVNLINAFVAAWVIGLFEDSIEKVVALAVLMPVIASMGGVAGNQTLTLITRGLALEQIGRSNARRLLLRELALSLLNGVFWSILVAVVAFYWFGSVELGIVFGVALVLNLITGAIAGTLVPLGLQRLGIDPALAGGVVLTAATDVIGFLSFLGLATMVLL